MERGLLAFETGIFGRDFFEEEMLGRMTGDNIGPGGFWPRPWMALDTRYYQDAVERRVVHIKGAYAVVIFKSSRASVEGESWVLAAKPEVSLWTGTAAASVVETQHTMATVGNRERACIMKDVSADVSLSECGRV